MLKKLSVILTILLILSLLAGCSVSLPESLSSDDRADEDRETDTRDKEDGSTYMDVYEPDDRDEPDDTDDPGSGSASGGGGFGGGDDGVIVDPPIDPPDDEGEGGDEGSEGGDEGSEGGDEDGESEENIPTEHDDSIPTEVIPELDEFIWTLKIDDTDEYPISEFGVYAKMHLTLNCVKDGGKNSFGKYECTGTWTIEFPNEALNEILSDTGMTYESSISNTLVIKDFTMTMEKYDFNKLYPDPSGSEQEKKSIPGMAAMAMGEMDLTFSQQGGATITDENESQYVSGAFPATPTSLSYKLKIASNGEATMEIKTKDTRGTLLIFYGQLYRKPKLPDD